MSGMDGKVMKAVPPISFGEAPSPGEEREYFRHRRETKCHGGHSRVEARNGGVYIRTQFRGVLFTRAPPRVEDGHKMGVRVLW